MGENADHVRRGIAATNARDREAIDAIWTDESLFHSTFAASEGRVFRGKAGIEEYFETLDDAFEHVWAHADDVVEAGDDRVAVHMRFTARGKASGALVEQSNGQVWTIRDDRVLKIDSYDTFADALEAVGVAR